MISWLSPTEKEKYSYTQA